MNAPPPPDPTDREAHLAPYAIRSKDSARTYPEPPDPLRNPFQVDCRRIIASTAFRRLEHKTQVFAPALHDHFRTRMTHTLEVAHAARTLAHALRANEDLAEAIALAHDLGHPPFGHAGELALNEAMRDHGGFNHNAHSLRVVEYLEHPVPHFRGINLTNETRSGLMVHETRYDTPSPQRPAPSVEAQIASLADRTAYNCHDLEDGIGAGFLDWPKLDRVALWNNALERCGVRGGTASIHAVRRLVLDAVLDALLEAAVSESRTRLASLHRPPPASTDAFEPLVALPPPAKQQLDDLESFLAAEVYRRDEIVEMDRGGQQMVRQLFEAYRADPSHLPSRYAKRLPEQGAARVICDYIAGMTDRFCQAEYSRVVATS